jgi:Predicted phosphate-binding enzymes, TIM-barrel fold
LIDPEKQKPEKAGEIAKIAERAGSSGILIGGSTSVDQERLDSTIREIKKNASLKRYFSPLQAPCFPAMRMRYFYFFAELCRQRVSN